MKNINICTSATANKAVIFGQYSSLGANKKKDLSGKTPLILKKMVTFRGVLSGTTTGTHDDIDGADST